MVEKVVVCESLDGCRPSSCFDAEGMLLKRESSQSRSTPDFLHTLHLREGNIFLMFMTSCVDEIWRFCRSFNLDKFNYPLWLLKLINVTHLAALSSL